MSHRLGYVLPRAVIIVFGWIVTYWILTALSTHLPPTAVYITGLAWVAGGIAGFGYLYRLRREFGTLPHQQAAAAPTQGHRLAANAARALPCGVCRQGDALTTV